MHLKHFGKIINGQRFYYNADLHKEALHKLEGQEFEETIKLKHKPVSHDAFGYYYGAVIGTALEFEMFGGWTKDEVDDFFSDMFLSYTKTLCLKQDSGDDDLYTVRKIESKGNGFSSKKMKEFTDKVIIWLAENNIVVPPSEAWHLGRYKTETIK
ncbi:MAG: hypothetical protein V4721_10535 [Bacteroidota bacterium]